MRPLVISESIAMALVSILRLLEDTKGYEQYIWVSSKSLNINTNAIAIDSDMTKGRMKNAFIKQRQGKFGNKVMLSKLAEFIS